MTALITPFVRDEIDLSAFETLCAWQIKEGTSGLIVCGTTGETPALSYEEQDRLIASAVKTAAGQALVVAGVGTNATHTTIVRAEMAEKLGADALLVVVPYYNKPGQEGLYLHFKAVHDACGLPIIIYNIPGRSAIDMTVETMARLAELDRIVAVKDATGDLARVARQREVLGPDFIQLSGEDATAVGFNAMGGVGCISVTANVAPALCAQMQAACLAGDYTGALAIQDRLIRLHRAMFCETNPAPVKYGASLLGLCRPDLRLPLAPLSQKGEKRVRDAMIFAGLSLEPIDA